jgi:hypothetical protein
VSRYVAQALESEERRDALRSWLAAQDAEFGPLPPEVRAEVRREWLDAANTGS